MHRMGGTHSCVSKSSCSTIIIGSQHPPPPICPLPTTAGTAWRRPVCSVQSLAERSATQHGDSDAPVPGTAGSEPAADALAAADSLPALISCNRRAVDCTGNCSSRITNGTTAAARSSTATWLVLQGLPGGGWDNDVPGGGWDDDVVTGPQMRAPESHMNLCKVLSSGRSDRFVYCFTFDEITCTVRKCDTSRGACLLQQLTVEPCPPLKHAHTERHVEWGVCAHNHTSRSSCVPCTHSSLLWGTTGQWYVSGHNQASDNMQQTCVKRGWAIFSRASPTLQESMCIQGVGGSMDTSCTQILRNCVGWQDRLHQATHITPPDVSRLCELGFVMTAARACKAPTSICTTLSCCFPAIYACRAKTWTGSLLAGGCSCTKVPHSGA